MSSGRTGFTCITCAVAFQDADLQRDHYKTDWHRYNLKRKVAELNPVTLDDFNGRMAKHEAQMKTINGEIKEPTGYCVACTKNFGTQKALENHKQSKKHMEAEKIFNQRDDKVEIENNRLNRKPDAENEEEDLDVEEVDSDEWDEDDEDLEDPIAPNDCLFCDHHSSNIDKNVIHMSEKHSFFLPDLDYLIDMEGLLKYLGAKVGQGHMCLWCNERKSAFQSVSAVRKHMQDKGHSKILHEGEALIEYADYYDYTSSYPEGERDDGDEEADIEAIDDDCFELVLPSGAKVGHRSLARYYKQSLNPERAVVLRRSSGPVMDHYKRFGWTGLTSSEVKKKAKDLQFMKRLQQKQWMKLGTKANKLQHHWRDPNGMC